MLSMGETLNLQHGSATTLEDRMIKIVNISGSMRKKPPITSKFCMVSKGKHWIFLDI
jgi:hypothetical protein